MFSQKKEKNDSDTTRTEDAVVFAEVVNNEEAIATGGSIITAEAHVVQTTSNLDQGIKEVDYDHLYLSIGYHHSDRRNFWTT